MLYGIIDYKNEKYIFKLQDNILHMELIDYLGKGCLIPDWMTNPPSFEDEYIRGINAENGHIVLFKPYPGNAGYRNMQMRIRIQYYIELVKDITISKLTIKGREIDYIYDIEKGIDNYTFGEEGTASCKTKTFEETTSQIEYFNVDDKKVEIYFTINRGISFGSCNPLTLHSTINLKFDETNDYDFLVKLCHILKKFLTFLCYRENVNIDQIDLYTLNDKSLYLKVGKIVCFDMKNEEETEKIVKERNISYESIKDHVGDILQDIEKGNLYLRHIPDSHREGLKMDHSKFIMVTAAIEWLFKILYPEGIPHSEKKLKAQNEIREKLEQKIQSSTGELKKQYKFLQRLIGADGLSQRIVQIGKDYNDLIYDVGKYLYSINELSDEFDYEKIGKRIQDQRNNFAHGNLDKEFEETAVLDLLYLERVVYLLQLSLYGIENNIAIEQVKRLFGMRFISSRR